MNCDEYRDWVAADVDGELGADAARVHAHVDGCPVCAAERNRQAAVRAELRRRALGAAPAADLRGRVVAALDRENAMPGARGSRVARRRISPVAWGAIGVAAAAVIALVVVGRASRFAPLIRSYDLADHGELALTMRTDRLEELEKFYRKEGGNDLPAHVVDLTAAGFQLVGGTIERFPTRRARLSVYSDGEHTIVCDYQLVRFFPFELPSNGNPVFFRERGVSFCARRIGDEVCLLATRMPLAMLQQKLGASTEG
jgi:anti-sigma factor RsiW